MKQPMQPWLSKGTLTPPASQVTWRSFGYLAFALIALAAPSATNAQFLGAPPATASQMQAPSNSGLQPPVLPQDSTLFPGDLFEVQIYGVPQFDYKARVDEDGYVSLPLVGRVQLGGQTMSGAEKAIAQKLIDGNIMKAPQVLIHVSESPNHFVTVSGEVKAPGPIPVYGNKYLLDIISAAGGFTPLSSPSVIVYRRGSQQPLVVQLPTDATAIGSNNIPIYPGDSIVVAKLGVVYVLGAFHQQGAVPLRNNSQLTLIEAMSLAGGVNYEAAARRAFILRSGPSGQVEIPFNVNDIIKHRVSDVTLQNEDIVLIPTNNMKAALKGGAAAVAASLLAGIGYLTVR